MDTRFKRACNEGDAEKVEEILGELLKQTKKSRFSLLCAIIVYPSYNEEILSLIFTFIETHKMEAELLHTAASSLGMKRMINMGVEKRGWDIHSEYKGHQPIQAAAKYGRMKEVKYLLERGANPNARTVQDINQPLHLACSTKGNIEIVKLLVEKGAELEEKGKDDNTPLKYAVTSEDLEVVGFLIAKGAKVDGALLNYAVNASTSDMIQLILKAKPLPKSKDIRKAFNLACGHTKVPFYPSLYPFSHSYI